MSNTNSTLVVIQTPPTADAEPLELAMALAAFDLPVTLLFIDAGLLWLCKDQQARRDGGKSPSRLLSALPMYDCDEVYHSARDQQALNLTSEQLSNISTPVQDDEIQRLVARHNVTLGF